MARGRSSKSAHLQAAARLDRVERQVVRARKALQKAEAQHAEAETKYFASVEQTLVARKSKPAVAREEGSPAIAP